MSDSNEPEGNALDIDPSSSEEELAELGHLRYFQDRITGLRERGLIPADSCTAILEESRSRVREIDRIGRIRAGLNRARALAENDPEAALTWAERVRAVAPNSQEPWNAIVDILWNAGREEQAIERCQEAFSHFPEFGTRLDALRADAPIRAERRRLEVEKAEREATLQDQLRRAKLALEKGKDDEVLALCDEILTHDPEQIDALAFAAFSLQRQERLPKALAHYQTLKRLQPATNAWNGWIQNVSARLRQAKRPLEPKQPPPVLSVPVATEPRLSWRTITGEFLEEHWQKLILCLAVFLIVVSSTIGAHVLLGPRLWSPIGKCALALVGTSLFAALGLSLMRWGAERAGRFMLITTLIVVPIHFMLAGELRLLSDPSVVHLAIAAVDLAAITVLCRVVAGQVFDPAEAGGLTTWLVAISAFNALTTRGSTLPWIGQLLAFEGPAIVFLPAVGWLAKRANAAVPETGEATRRDRPFELGLLAFAMLASVLRNGVYAMSIPPTFFAVPLMLSAAATLGLVERVAVRSEPRKRLLGWLKLLGYTLSAAAFALALQRQPVAPRAEEANTLATALLGLSLYVASLRRERRPLDLYLAIAACGVSLVAGINFVIGPERPLEVFLGRLLGYPGKPPFPFRAVQIWGLNILLAGIARWFATRWYDRRLAWHCHAIGLPLSVAACVLSTFEPKAAVISLSLYAAVYLIAARLYKVEWLTYLGIAAAWGAGFHLDVLVNPSSGFRSLAIEAAAFGFVCRAIAWLFARVTTVDGDDRRLPWLHASLALAWLALGLASLGLTVEHSSSLHSALMFLPVSGLLIVLSWDYPVGLLTHAALGSSLTTWILAVIAVLGVSKLDEPKFGLTIAAFDVLVMIIARRLRLSRSTSPYTRGIPRFVIVTTLGSAALQILFWKGGWAESLAFMLDAAVLLWTTVKVPNPGLVHLSLGLFAVAGCDLTAWLVPWGDHASGLAGWEAIAAGLLGLIFWIGAWFARRDGRVSLYEEPCLRTALAMTGFAAALALYARGLSLGAYPLSVGGLLLNVVLILLIGIAWNSASLTYYAIATYITATYVVLFSVGKADPNKAHVLGLNAELQGLLLWGVGIGLGRFGALATRLYVRPLFVCSLLLTVASIPLAYWSPTTMALASLSFLLMIKSFPRAEWLYPVVGALGLAIFYAYFAERPWTIWLVGLVGGAYAVWVLAVLVREFKAGLCRIFGVPQLRYEFALANASVALVFVALMVRSTWGSEARLEATEMAWFPLSIAGLCFLLRVPYHTSTFVHAGFALITWTLVSLTAPGLRSGQAVSLALAGAAFLYAILVRFVPLAWPMGLLRLGFDPGKELGVARFWSTLLALAGAAMNGFQIATAVATTLYPDIFGSASVRSTSTWIQVLEAMLLLSLSALLLGRPAFYEGLILGSLRCTNQRLKILLGVGILWWLGVSGSPLIERRLMPPENYLPLVTAAFSLLLVVKTPFRLAWHSQAPTDPEFGNRSITIDPFVEQAIFLLAILGAVFTKATVGLASVGSLLLAASALGWIGAWSRSSNMRGLATQAGAIGGTVAFALAGLVLTRRAGWNSDPAKLLGAAAGITFAGHLSLLLGELGRRFGARESTGHELPPLNEWALTIERIGFLGSYLAAGSVALASLTPFLPDESRWLVAASIGVLVAIGGFHSVLAVRWRSELSVYLAQLALLGSYAVYRRHYPAPVANDALLLTMLAYIDFGIAEAVDRMGTPVFARPLRFVSYLLPVLPLIPMIGARRFDEVGTFHMLAAGTFYGVAFASTRWRLLGYATAIAYNAALWAWWSRLGWTLTDQPQFYCVPVGLSAILFAEASRDELGRSTVNGIRSVGLLIVYLTTAFPVLRDQNFGAWLALLVFSLLGIFAGIGLRIRTFLWLGLATFLLDIGYQLARFGADHAVARWGIMLGLGIALFLFVALNEKKQIVQSLRKYYERTQDWE